MRGVSGPQEHLPLRPAMGENGYVRETFLEQVAFQLSLERKYKEPSKEMGLQDIIRIEQMQHKGIQIYSYHYYFKGYTENNSTLGSCKPFSVARVKCEAGVGGRRSSEGISCMGGGQVIKGLYFELLDSFCIFFQNSTQKPPARRKCP